MYKLCKTEQSARRQRELEQGLLKAMSTCHYDEISVSDLCDQLNIPRKSFYRYFSGKDGALHALIDHTLAGFFETPIESIQHKGMALEELTQTFCFWKNWYTEHRNIQEAAVCISCAKQNNLPAASGNWSRAC